LSTEASHAPGSPSGNLEEILKRLKRVEGQIRGIQKMLEEKRNCSQVLVQISAARSALDSISRLVLAGNVKRCFSDLSQSSDLQNIEDLVQSISLLFSKIPFDNNDSQ